MSHLLKYLGVLAGSVAVVGVGWMDRSESTASIALNDLPYVGMEGADLPTDPPFVWAMADTAGVSWVRINMYWNDVDSDRDGANFNWSHRDAHIDSAAARGYDVLVVFGDYGGACGSNWTATCYDAWRDFVRGAMERYDGDPKPNVDYWEVWNEPYQTDDNNPSQIVSSHFPGTLSQWDPIVIHADEARDSAASTETLVGPGAIPGDGGNLGYLTASLLRRSSGPHFDVVSTHFYGTGDGIVAAANLTRDSLEAAGFGSRKIWYTEFGKNLPPITDSERYEVFTKVFLLARDSVWLERAFHFGWDYGQGATANLGPLSWNTTTRQLAGVDGETFCFLVDLAGNDTYGSSCYLGYTSLVGFIPGPYDVPPDYECTCYSNVSGGTPPYSYQWSGALYGTTANIVGSLPESNDLTFKVTDAWGNSETDAQWITVDSEFEECIY